ncbi:MAG: DUF4345 domain-containing protein [Deltaproteobacteria bacterium]|nr:DUF4345 domain-containing protein [Deltaproteobacteria bacterium]
MHHAILVVSGLVAVGVGAALLFDPVGFEASAGVELPTNASILSEMRASGGALLAGGVLVTAGAFVRRLTFSATLVATVLYLAYGSARALGILADGMPADGLVVAMVVEIAIGAACLGMLTRNFGVASART